MPDPVVMQQAVRTYLAAFRAADLNAIVELFAGDATVEDPVGTPKHEGLAAIREFYGKSIELGAVLEQQGATRVGADYAAFAFEAHIPGMGQVEVIDTFRFNEDGKIIEMRAFFGPENFRTA